MPIHSCSLPHIFNLSLSQGRLPVEWKISFIVIIPKCSSNLDNPSNYRPISLLSIISKLLENMFILSFTTLVSNTILSLHLNYFSSSFSISSALLMANHSLHTLRQTNKLVGACFLDLKIALNSVPHNS